MIVTEFILCEDVRAELGNKVSVMGIYSGEITIPVPNLAAVVPLRLGIYERVRLEDEPIPNAWRLVLAMDGTELFNATLPVRVTDPMQLVTVATVLNAVPINGPGTVSVATTFMRDGEQLGESSVRTLRVMLTPEQA